MSAGLVWGWDGEMLELGLGAGTPKGLRRA